MSEKLTYKDILIAIKENKSKPNFSKKWFEENYKSQDNKLPLICSCGKEFSLKVSTIRKKGVKYGKQCEKCVREAIAKGLNQHYTNLAFEGFTALLKEKRCKRDFTKKWFKENYDGIKTTVPLLCRCKKPFLCAMNAFKENPYCNDCRTKIKIASKYGKVVEMMKAKGYKPNFNELWFSENFKNEYTHLPCICEGCKDECEYTYMKFSKITNSYCKKCAVKRGKTEKYNKIETLMSAKKSTLKTNLEWFIENYKNVDTRIEVVCQCGEEFDIRYATIELSPVLCLSCRHKGKREKYITYGQIYTNENIYKDCYVS